MSSRDHLRAVDPSDGPDPADIHYRELLGTDRLAPLRLPAESTLADAARRSPLLAVTRALALWVGDGRRVDDETGTLSADDARTAAADLSNTDGVTTAIPVTTRDVAQHWELADDLGFIDIGEASATMASGVDDWPDGDDGTVLDVWKQAFASLCAWSAALDVELAGEPSLRLQGAGATVLPLFAARENGLSRAELSAMVHEVAVIDADGEWSEDGWQRWVSVHGDPAETLYDRLASLGAVERTDETVRLTPLGLYALWSEVHTEVDIPLLPAAEQMCATDMVSIALLGTDEQVRAEWQAWSSTREPVDAARELAAVAAEGSPGERASAVALLHELGADVHDVWRDLLGVAPLRPYAKQALSEAVGGNAEWNLTDHDVAWLTADMFCDVDVDNPPEGIGDLLSSTVHAGEESVFEVLWKLDHPGAPDTLRVIGRYHPDKKVAKAARKAAFKVERAG
ncbi:hypothetical protein [Saccharomonospora azurea]|uniref:hypothetical protein n=1 Tax=Saccharomonospora azurea TaxID=40988 RepID=UPI00240964A6|nr:hypothetical protein [Saccharomonospora azurea]